MYSLRLNTWMKDRVERVLHDTFSEACDFDPNRAISMPIRGSDKCMGDMHVDGGLGGESECFPNLERYMAMAETIRHFDPRIDTIILTSDDERYLNDRHNYTKDGRWRFIINKFDTLKGSGTITELEKLGKMDDVFLSFYSSFQLQLKGKYFLLNCDSNVHNLVMQLVKSGGCSSVPNPVVYCLGDQYADNRICGSDNFESCHSQKMRQIEVKYGTKVGDEPPK